MAELVSLIENGVLIEGLITSRSRRFIEIEMTTPYSNLRTDATVPLFAVGHVSLLGPEGERCAMAMLKRLGWQADFMTTHEAALRKRWQIIEHSLKELHRGFNAAVVEMIRVDLRRRFQSGALRQREYQMELIELRGLQNAYEDRRGTIIRSFMADWSSGLDLAQVLVFIDGASGSAGP